MEKCITTQIVTYQSGTARSAVIMTLNVIKKFLCFGLYINICSTELQVWIFINPHACMHRGVLQSVCHSVCHSVILSVIIVLMQEF